MAAIDFSFGWHPCRKEICYPCKHVSPGVVYPVEPVKTKIEPLLWASGFCFPLGIFLMLNCITHFPQTATSIRETKHTIFNLESTARH